jgi:hypothetical protein
MGGVCQYCLQCGHLAFPLRKHTLTGVIAVDQPVGTGFSYGSTDKYIKELKDVRFPPVCRVNSYSLISIVTHPGTRIHAKLLSGIPRVSWYRRRFFLSHAPATLTLPTDLYRGRELRRTIYTLYCRRITQAVSQRPSTPKRYCHRERMDRPTKSIPRLSGICTKSQLVQGELGC